jgi:hypothetical protein
MRFFFDENLPPTLPKALHILHKTSPDKAQVMFIPDLLGYGTADEAWIPAIQKDGPATVVTCDYQIHRRKDQRLLYQENGLGLIVLRPNSKKKSLRYWQKVQKIITHWENIIEVERTTTKPYLFLLKVTGKPELLYDGKNWQDK